MDDAVAVAVKFGEGDAQYFLVYGRIFGSVETDALEAAVLRFAPSCGLEGSPTTATVCATLQEASGEPYFFECLFEMTRDAVSPSIGPYGRWRHGRWRKKIARDMNEGRKIWYLGRPTAAV
ncbi:MAG TPA: hypothetical protein VM784_09635 [Actinomycetota bacterium]|nr:hypothetical protein [Actinomycetota bacterium]